MFALSSLNKYIIALKGLLQFPKKAKSFGGKFVQGKKGLRFWMVSDVDKKYTKSFGGKKSCFERLIFSNWKFCIFFCFFVFLLDAVQILRNFFPLGNPPYAKKSKRESLYFDLLPGPFKITFFYHLYN